MSAEEEARIVETTDNVRDFYLSIGPAQVRPLPEIREIVRRHQKNLHEALRKVEQEYPPAREATLNTRHDI